VVCRSLRRASALARVKKWVVDLFKVQARSLIKAHNYSSLSISDSCFLNAFCSVVTRFKKYLKDSNKCRVKYFFKSVYLQSFIAFIASFAILMFYFSYALNL